MTISNDELFDSFIETNCFIRLATMKRLALKWQEQNEKKQFALAVVFVEQFIALTEMVVMLLYAMIEKSKKPEESLFCHYMRINISEGEGASCYSTRNLRGKFASRQTNSEFCDLWRLDIKQLPVEPAGDDFRKGIDILLDILENHRDKVPLVKAYNKIKHGMLVQYKIRDGEIHVQIIIELQPIDNRNATATVAEFTANHRTLQALENKAKTLSDNLMALFAIIRKAYV